MISKKGRRNVFTSIALAIAVCVKSFAQVLNVPPHAVNDSTMTTEDVAVSLNVVANDTDFNGNLDPSTVDLDINVLGTQQSVTTPNGTYTVDAAGVVTFTPAPGYFGVATRDYTVRDSSAALSNSASIKITVTSVNDVPVATNDTGQTNMNQEVRLKILDNDSDSDGTLDTSKVDLDVGVAGVQKEKKNTPQGDWVMNNGELRFKPKASFTGTATNDYTVQDNEGGISNIATITITVINPNTPPVATNDSGATTPTTPVSLNVVANDTDPDGTIDPTKVDLVTGTPGVQNAATTTHGGWSVNPAGVVTYTPAVGFLGSATLNYFVSDNDGAVSNAATITISVQVGNAPPVATNDAGGTTLNKPVSLNVVANDSDPDGTVNVATVDLNTGTAGIQNTANTAQGSWSVNATGIVTYNPIALFLGSATLNYTVNDNNGATSNAATITITVQAINLAPVAVNDNATTNKNKAVAVKVTDNDTDIDGSITVSTVDLNQTLAGIQTTNVTPQGDYAVNAAGVVTYTPASNFTGVAAQTYTVNDNAGATSNTATVNITVQNVNAPPVAANDNGATSQNTVVAVNVVANDTDSDGVIDAAKVDLNTTTAGIQNTNTTAQGNFTVNNLGVVSYSPAKDFTGSATLNYTVSDNNGALSNVASITIAVQPLNAPVANEDVATTKANEAVDINVVANDLDSDGTIDVTTVDLNTTTAGVQKTVATPEGNFSVNTQGIVTYTPKKDFFGSARVKYTVNDNKGVLSNVANVTVTVEEVPDMAPEITAFEEPNDTLRYTPGSPIQITGEFEVSDVDDDSLAVAEVGFVSQVYAAGFDYLIFESMQGITGSFDPITGLLTLRGKSSLQGYTAAVRSVQYNYTGEDEFHQNIKRVYVRLSDGNSFSELKERVIRVNSALTDLDIPTAFTPNNDGANDTWRILTPANISGSDFADAEVMVYDKRGTVVFGVRGLENTWDGTYQGKHLPVDTYYYTIDLKQTQKRYRGVVAILR